MVYGGGAFIMVLLYSAPYIFVSVGITLRQIFCWRKSFRFDGTLVGITLGNQGTQSFLVHYFWFFSRLGSQVYFSAAIRSQSTVLLGPSGHQGIQDIRVSWHQDIRASWHQGIMSSLLLGLWVSLP